MNGTVKGLIAKCWKNEAVKLEPGKHELDEVLTIRLTGTVVKQNDSMVAPTTSIPLIPALALFWQKAGITRAAALKMLRECLCEAMTEGVKEDAHIQDRIQDVDEAIKAVREDLLAKLPKMKRKGAVVTKGLQIEVLPMAATTTVPKPRVAVA